MDPISQSTTIYDVYYIEEKTINHRHLGSLAIHPSVNCESHLVSWQDTDLHPKSISFKKVEIDPETKQMTITVDEREGIPSKQLIFKLLTVDFFKKCVNGNLPQRALSSDEALRSWYSAFIQNPYDENLG